MYKPILTLIFSFLLINSANSQNKLIGLVTADTDSAQVLPFASVVLFSNDTPFKSTITDLRGNYIFTDIKSNSYQIKCSYLGYEEYSEELHIKKGTNKLDISLKPATVILDEAEVIGSRVVVDLNKTTYAISEKERESANSSLDILSGINTLNIDYNTNSIKSTIGNVKFLVNGISADDKDIVTYQPEDIIKVEYYDIPPSKYSGYSAVVNVIVKEKITGLDVGISGRQAIATGYTNFSLYSKKYFKNNRIGIRYNLERRVYKRSETDRSLIFNIDTAEIKNIYNGDKNPFGYTNHYIQLDYLLKKDSNYTFNIKYQPSINESFSKNGYNLANIVNNDTVRGRKNSSTDLFEFTNIVDLYFSKQINSSSELELNVVGMAYTSENSRINIEQDQSMNDIFNDSVDFKNEKESVIGEVRYRKNFEKISVDAGIKHYSGFNMQKITNSFDSPDYNMNSLKEEAFFDLASSYQKFSYQLMLSGSYNYFKESFLNNTHSYFFFQPKSVIGYKTGDKSMIKMIYAASTENPSLSQLNNNSYYITERIIHQGNSELIPYNYQAFSLNFTLTEYKNFSLYLQPMYYYAKNMIMNTFVPKETTIIKTYQNQAKTFGYRVNYSVGYKTEKLNVSVHGNVIRTINESANSLSDFDFTSWNMGVNATYMPTPKLRLFASLKTNNFEINDVYMSRPENYSEIGVSYGPVKLMMLWFTSESAFYESKTVKASIVQEHSTKNIYDNGRMIVIGFELPLSFGETGLSDRSRRLFNRDNDKGN